MNSEVWIVIGGIYHLLLIVFHLMFWKIFDWRRDLASLGFLNRQIMQVLNLCLIFVFVIFAYVSFEHSAELLSTGLGQALLLLIAVFWFARAIEQVIFFRLRRLLSIGFLLAFVLGGLLYLYPWWAAVDVF